MLGLKDIILKFENVVLWVKNSILEFEDVVLRIDVILQVEDISAVLAAMALLFL